MKTVHQIGSRLRGKGESRPNRVRKIATTSRTISVLVLLIAICVASCIGSIETAHAQPGNFNGTWSAEWCGERSGIQCGYYRIWLKQDRDRVCGSYESALPDLRRVDDGTITGTNIDGTGVIAVRSHQGGPVVLARIRMMPSGLHWQAIEEMRMGTEDHARIIAVDNVSTTQAGSANSDKHHDRRALLETCCEQHLAAHEQAC